MTVYITQEAPNLDFSDADRFGEIKFITAREFSAQANSLINKDIMSDIRHAASKFDPDTDYLLVCGDPLVIGAAMYEFLNVAGVVRVLKYRRTSRGYVEHIVDTREEEPNVSYR